jgi:hypothetical protein
MLKNYILGCCLLALAIAPLKAQESIQNLLTTEQAASKMGQEVVLKGKVVSTYFDRNGTEKPLYLNLDKRFPNNPIAVFIKEKDAAKFPLRDKFEGKNVRVKGKVVAWKYINNDTGVSSDKPAIILSEKEQIEIEN